MSSDRDVVPTHPLLNWPVHWDDGPPNHPYGVVEPAARKLFRERLKVMKAVLTNTYKHNGFEAAAEVRERLYNSRSARIGSAIQASRLSDDALADLFRTEGAQHLPSWPCVEAPSDIWLEGHLPFRYDVDGEFLHIERKAAAFGVGLHALDCALGDIM